MQQRALGRTGWNVSEVSFGAWAIGGSWGPTDDTTSLSALSRALDRGVNFIDTADVYGDGRSERLIGRVLAERGNPSAQRPVRVATKAGRRLSPHVAGGYTAENLRGFAARSMKNLGTDCLDLLQLHCPPGDVYARDDVFSALDGMKRDGMIRHYGVSVEKVSEAVEAITRYPDIQTVQIIVNLFRVKPIEGFFPLALERGVGILARVPLASGLLTGRIARETAFAPDDHRQFNRNGEQFDMGETFSGVPFELAMRAVEMLRPLAAQSQVSLARFALRWILMFPAVSCVIPGMRTPAQAEENIAAAETPSLTDAQMAQARAVYDRVLRDAIHPRW